jgi:formate dehydrogenase subunit delta
MSPDKLIYMANQIAKFMESKPDAEGLQGFAGHVNDFWEPRMRAQFFELIDGGAEGFRPLVVKAASSVRRPVES